MDETPSATSTVSIREFSLPATFQFRSVPGRVERFLRRSLRSRDRGTRFVATEATDRFYLPAMPR